MTSQILKVKISYNDPSDFYEICKKQIGKGGSGSVHRCTCKKSKKLFAVKILYDGDDAENEIRVWSNIPPHPNVLALIEVFVWDEFVYAVMDLMSYSLTAIIPSPQRYMPMLPPKIILRIIGNLISAMNHLHKYHIAHCDIKSENVLFDANGVSTCHDEIHPNAPLIGTVWWNSPNSLNLETASPMKDDIWSLAVTILELLGMDPPFFHIQDRNQAFRCIKTLSTNPQLPNLKEYGEDFEIRMHKFLEVCFLMNPIERFSAEELFILFEMVFLKN